MNDHLAVVHKNSIGAALLLLEMAKVAFVRCRPDGPPWERDSQVPWRA